MRFKLFSGTPDNINNFVALLAALGLDSAAVTRSNDYDAETGDLSLLDVWELSKAYRERFWRGREEAGDLGMPNYPGVATARVRRDLELGVHSSVIRRGVMLNVYARGERGSLNFRAEYANHSIRRGGVEMRLETNLFGRDAAGEPFAVGESAEGLAKLWQAGEDEALFARMAELYHGLTPPLPLPSLLAYWGDRELRVRRQSRPPADPTRMAPVGRGIYKLRAEASDDPGVVLLTLDLPEETGERTGYSLDSWRTLAREHFPHLELVYFRRAFSHRRPQTDEEDAAVGQGDRWQHDGRPFTIRTINHNNGYITGYRIAFEDGFETDADCGEAEFKPYVPGEDEVAGLPQEPARA